MAAQKRPKLVEGIDWIAKNDEPTGDDPDEIAGYISTLLLADLFEVEASLIANEVLYRRGFGPSRSEMARQWIPYLRSIGEKW